MTVIRLKNSIEIVSCIAKSSFFHSSRMFVPSSSYKDKTSIVEMLMYTSIYVCISCAKDKANNYQVNYFCNTIHLYNVHCQSKSLKPNKMIWIYIYNTITFQNKIDQILFFVSNLQHNIILSEQCFKSR